MKLKDLIFENKEELKKKLSDFKTDIPENRLLWRGYDQKIEEWAIKKIREDREPRDTPNFTQLYIDAVTQQIHPEKPKRSESKFATTSHDEAKKYVIESGDVFVCFPEKDSNIVSFSFDSWREYLGTITGNFERIYHNQDYFDFDRIRTGKDAKLYNFIELVLDIYGNRQFHKIADLVEIIDEHGDMLIKYTQQPELKHGPEGEVAKLIGSTRRYFNDMKNGIKENSDEIMFDGDKYLLINEEWFERNFRFVNGSWKLK